MIRRFKLIWIVIGRPPSLSLSFSPRRFQRQPPIYRNYYVYLSYSLNSTHEEPSPFDFCRATISYTFERTPPRVDHYERGGGESTSSIRPLAIAARYFRSGVDKNHRKEERKENVNEGRSRMGVEIVTSSRFLRVRLYYVFQRPAPLIHFVKLDLRHPLPSLFTTAPRAVLATFDSRAWRLHRGRESATNSSSIFLRSSVDAIPR